VRRPGKLTAGSLRLERDPAAIPLFAKVLADSSVPLAGPAAIARSGRQGRPQAGVRPALGGREQDGVGCAGGGL